MAVVITLAVVALVAASCEAAPPTNRRPSPDAARAVVFKGLGVWWDVYDWSPTFRNSATPPPLGVSDVDRLARNGVQTLYIQTASYRRPEEVLLDPALMRRIVDRAHSHDIRVVGWYLPEYNDVKFDLDRLVAIAQFGFDGLGVDMESTANGDIAARNANLMTESAFMRGMFPDLPIAAIPVTPIIWEELNRSWWPNFPYKGLVPFFDAWMPMAYWSYRYNTFTNWYDPYQYTYQSVVRLRALTGQPELPVHPIGGEATPTSSNGMPTPPATTTSDIFWMNAAMVDSGSIGGSIYDDNTTPPALYDSLQQFRRELVK